MLAVKMFVMHPIKTVKGLSHIVQMTVDKVLNDKWQEFYNQFLSLIEKCNNILVPFYVYICFFVVCFSQDLVSGT